MSNSTAHVPSADAPARLDAALSAREAGRRLVSRFRLPDGGQAERFAAAQVQVCRSAPTLFPYLYPLQNHVRDGTSPPSGPPDSARARVKRFGGAQARRINDGLPRRTLQADVLLCGVWVWERPQEVELLEEVLAGLLRAGRSVLVLLHRGTASWRRLRRRARAFGAGDRVTLLDPRGRVGRAADRARLEEAWARTRTDVRRVLDSLRPAELTLDADAWSTMHWTARTRVLWERWADHLHFDAAVVRCHWLPLCSSVAQTARQRGVPVTTLQQGVVSHTMDVPVRADRYLCFGPASETTLRALDGDFASATGAPTQCDRYEPVGSLIDPVEAPPPAFEAGTLLVIGQFTGWATDYYGLHRHRDALLALVRRLLAEAEGLRQVVVRPHPADGNAALWSSLQEQFPARVALSSAYERSISVDLRQSSAVLGLFSGALATAAAWGRPTFFLQVDDGYRTPDLAPFSEQEGRADRLFERIRETMSDRTAYARTANACREAARHYFHQGGEADIAEAFGSDPPTT